MDSHRLPRKVATLLERLLPNVHGATLGVAVSGGPDSVALLAALVSLVPAYDLHLQVLHVNHGLRPEADTEQQLVESLCQRWQVPCHVEKLLSSRHSGIEAWAREARYRFFYRLKEAARLNAVALAHTRDDQAETVLFRFLRGSARRGLAGIPPIRDGWILRPLLGCSRQEVMHYLTEQHLPFATDASNVDPRYTRNKIRHQLLPLLEKEFSPRMREHLAQMAEVFREEETWLEALEDAVLARVQESPAKLSVSRLLAEPEALQARVLRRWLESQSLVHDVTFVHLTQLRAMVACGRPTAVDVPGAMSVRREGLFLICEEKQSEAAHRGGCPPYAHPLVPGQELDLPQGGWRIRLSCPFSWQAPVLNARSDNRWQAVFDADASQEGFVVRNFQRGDRIVPLGLGKQKKVHDVFIDAKIPRQRRQTWPLIAVGAQLAWVPGCVRGEVARIRTTTRQVYRAEVMPLPEK